MKVIFISGKAKKFEICFSGEGNQSIHEKKLVTEDNNSSLV